ncbi:MAG: hypothetical protein LBK94_07940 [Prevotellaceae bacterium]|jgi:hypothetical protein|nr:hypothetical protein [Prevotellaceae bacterium]
MKRTTALILLLLANMIMLAHAFVPHCDYGQTSVNLSLPVIHSENGNNPCQSGSYRHSHDADEECFLAQNYLILESNEKIITPVDFILFSCPFVSVNHNIPLEYLKSLTLQYKPYLLSYYCAFVLPVRGLRAPPAC